MSFLRTRVGRERPRRPLWRDLLPVIFLLLTILFATTRPFRAEAQSQAPSSTPAPAPASSPAPASQAPGAPASAPPPAGGNGAAANRDAAPESKPANAPADKPSSPDDTNVEEPDGPRRAAQPKLSSDEAPEYRESADNNVTFPVDI